MNETTYISPKTIFLDSDTQPMLAGESILIIRDGDENVDIPDDVYTKPFLYSIWDENMDDQ